METRQHFVSNGDGWRLALVQNWRSDRVDKRRNPVLIVPGYGMNSFIFGFHPRGLSLAGYLVEAGFEVWRVDMRQQGEAVREGGSDNYKLEDLALTDLRVAIETVLERTQSEARKVDVLGASLGATIMFILATMGDARNLGSLISIGGPVRWVKVHPVLKIAFGSPRIAGWIRLRGTRRLAEIALPLFARHAPWVLSIYLNPAITDVTATRELVKTVEDPNRFVNRQIAHWIADRDLIVRGTNLSTALARITQPLMCVVANADGIVPQETAEFPYHHVRSAEKALLQVGAHDLAIAHADLFISNEAHERVFRPIAEWLRERHVPPSGASQ